MTEQISEAALSSVIMAAACSVLRDREGLLTREDLFQEGWIASAKILAAYNTALRVPIEKFLLICLRRRMGKILRSFSRVIAPEPDIASIVHSCEYDLSEFSGISERDMMILRMRFVEEKRPAEVARILGLAESTVVNRITHVRKDLLARMR